MESTRTKAEIMKPVLLKAGIPLALSVAGFIYARIMARRVSVPKLSSMEAQVKSLETDSSEEFRDEERFHSFNSTSFKEDEESIIASTPFMNSVESMDIENKRDYDGEGILCLRSRIEDLQEREWELEMRFLRYHDLKEQESVIIELRHKLSLEMTRIELLGREVSSMEAENQRLESLVEEYMKVLDQLKFSKLENGLLRRKVRKLLRKTKHQSHVMREHNLKIEDREAEILRNHDELERKTTVIIELEDEERKLQTIVGQLHEERNELLNRLDLAEKSASSISKIEAEGVTMEDYNKLSKELEQLQNDRAAEVKELIYLRWSNACLRHELMRTRDQQEQNQERETHSDLDIQGSGENGDSGLGQELDGLVLEHSESCFGITISGQACSKRPKLLKKFRRWVEGNERMKGKLDDREKHEIKCFGRHSVSHGAEEELLHGRKSCSSA